MGNLARNRRTRVRGASLPEYALLLVAILLIAAGAFKTLGRSVSSSADKAASAIAADSGGGIGGAIGAAIGGMGGAVANAMGAAAAGDGSNSGGFGGIVKDFFKGAILGDFSNCQSAACTTGQILGGFVPIVGQLADLRDTGAAVIGVFQGREGAWRDLGLSMVGYIPGAGDAIKGVLKGGDDIAAAAVKNDGAMAGMIGAVGKRGDDVAAAASRQSEIYGTASTAIKKGDDGVDRVMVQGPKRLDGTRVVDEVPLDTPVYRVQEPDLPVAPHPSPYFDPDAYGLPMNQKYEVLYVSPDRAGLENLRQRQGYFDQGLEMHEGKLGDWVQNSGDNVMVFRDSKLEFSEGIEGYVIVKPVPWK